MEQKLRILHIEDEPRDSELIAALLKREGLAAEIDRVEEISKIKEALERGGYALILSDYTIPGLDAREALQLAQARRPEIPFVFVSGTLGEETAIEALKQGATDYVLKQRMTRLGAAVRRALREAEERARRNRAEERLQRSERNLRRVQALNEANLAQLRAVIGSMTEGLAVFDAEGNLLDINPAGLALHGFDTVEGMRHHLSELRQIFELRDLAGDLLPAEQWPIARALRGETFTGYQVHVRRLDDSRQWFASYGGAPVRDAQGKMIFGIVTLHDTTELRRAEAALARRSEQQEILSKALADLLSAEDPKELVRDLFPRVAIHLGVDTYFNFMVHEQEEALYLNAYGGISEATARQIHWLEFGQAICGTVAQTQEPIVVTDVQNCGDERTTLIRSLGIHSYVCYPLSTGGQLLGTVSFASHTRAQFDPDALEFLRLISNYAAVALERARTMQALRQSEERHRVAAEDLRAIMNAAPVGLLVAHDPECHLITGNGPAHEILGVPMEENISATPGPQEASPCFRIYRHGQETNGAELPMQVAGATGRVVHDEELEVVRRDGTRRTIMVTAAPLYSPEGIIRGAVGAAVDITSRKQVEEALRSAHERTETILNSITDSFFAIDHQWRFTYVNAEAERVLRRSATQLVGGQYSELFPRAEAFEAHYARVFASGKPDHFEEYYAPLQTWFECHAYPSPEGLSVYFRDINTRKKVEQALRESEQKFRAIFEQAAIGIGRVSFTDARWIDANDAFCRMLGYTREEMCATPWPDMTHPEDVDLDLVSFRRMAAGELDTYFVEKRFVHKDGHHVWARLTLSSVRAPEGRPAYEIAVIENITARKQAEETLRQAEQQFRVLAESIPQLVWTADAHGQVDYFNERWWAYTGLTLQQSTSGWLGVVHPDDRSGTFERWTKALTTGQPYETEYRFRRHDGQYRWFLGRGVPLRDSQGAVERWFGTCTDIDEHKRTLEALRESQGTLAQAKDELARTNRDLDRTVRERTAELQETIAELEQMSYSMVHDLRAPLRAIQSFGGIVAQDPENRLTEESREMIGKMITATARMDHLVRDVLNYGRVVREELPLESVDVGMLARGILETYPNLRSSRAEVRVASDLPSVIGNAAALTQCLSQLLDNAVKFAKPGQTPSIQIKREPGDSGWVRVVVEDDGIGIAPELRQKVFGIFQQLRNTGQGTGMGLAIVKKAVERMGGRVGVESEPGQGSRFWIELRAAAEPPLQRPD